MRNKRLVFFFQFCNPEIIILPRQARDVPAGKALKKRLFSRSERGNHPVEVRTAVFPSPIGVSTFPRSEKQFPCQRTGYVIDRQTTHTRTCARSRSDPSLSWQCCCAPQVRQMLQWHLKITAYADRCLLRKTHLSSFLGGVFPVFVPSLSW